MENQENIQVDNGWDEMFFTILKKNWFYIVAFCVPWLAVFIHGLINNVWPVGSGSLLEGDLQLQYVQLYYELWHKVHDGGSLFFSWNAMGGYDFMLNMMYYLISPFSLLVLIVPESGIVTMVQIVMVLKCSCVTLAMTYFFYHTKYNTLKERKELVSLFLGMAFGLSNGMIYFMKFFNWMDAMIIFPFLLLEIERMIEKKSWKRYCVLLAVAMLTNYYIVIQVCIFLVLWFVMQIDRDTTDKLKKFLLFVGSSVLAAIMAMVVLLPSGMSVSERESVDMEYVTDIFIKSVQNDLADVIYSLFPMQPITTMYFSPNVYFSVLGVLLGLLFVFIRLRKNKKIYLIVISLFMFASFCFGFLNIIWHGFTVPTGVYNRFVNMYIFLMLFIGLQVLIHLNELRLRHIAISVFVVLLSFIYVLCVQGDGQDFNTYVFTILLVIVYIAVLVLFRKKVLSYSNVLIVVVLVGMLELFVNSYNGFASISSVDFWSEEGNTQVVELSKDVELEDGQKLTYVPSFENMGLIADQPVMAGFLSCSNGNMIRLFRELGMNSGSNVLFGYSCGSPLLNGMFNIVYGIGNDEAQFCDVEKVDELDGYSLYQMKRQIGLGYMVDENIRNWDVTNGLPFDLQNSFVELATGEADIYDIVTPVVVAGTQDGEIYYVEDDFEQYGVYTFDMLLNYGDERDAIQMQFTVEEDMDLYFLRSSSIGMYGTVYIDDAMISDDVGESSQNMTHIGNVKKGQIVTIFLNQSPLTLAGTDFKIQCQFANFNEETFQNVYNELCRDVFDVEVLEDTYIKGSIIVEEKGVMLTSIPAMKGFNVLVDSVSVEYEDIGNALIGISLEEGEHTIEFVYETPYFKIAIIISMVGAILFMIIAFLQIYYKNQGTNDIERVKNDEI